MGVEGWTVRIGGTKEDELQPLVTTEIIVMFER